MICAYALGVLLKNSIEQADGPETELYVPLVVAYKYGVPHFELCRAESNIQLTEL